MQSDQPLNAGGWEQHLQEAINRFKKKSQAAQIFKMIYTEVVHSVWIKKNMRVFEKKSRKWEVIAREIACVCIVRAPPRIRNVVISYRF